MCVTLESMNENMRPYAAASPTAHIPTPAKRWRPMLPALAASASSSVPPALRARRTNRRPPRSRPPTMTASRSPAPRPPTASRRATRAASTSAAPSATRAWRRPATRHAAAWLVDRTSRTVCDACCGKPWLASQHARRVGQHYVRLDRRFVHGPRDAASVECSGECWNSVGVAAIAVGAGLEQCTASPLFLLVYGVFALRLLGMFTVCFGVPSGAATSRMLWNKQGEHAGVLRRCFLWLCRRCCCCGGGAWCSCGRGRRERAKQRGAGATPCTAPYPQLVHRRRRGRRGGAPGDDGPAADGSEQTGRAAGCNGHTTVEEFEASDEQRGQLQEGDHRKVAVFRSSKQEPQPQPEPEPELQIKNPVGQVVWVVRPSE